MAYAEYRPHRGGAGGGSDEGQGDSDDAGGVSVALEPGGQVRGRPGGDGNRHFWSAFLVLC